jgi:DNA-binding MarR family transcriptional regulator
MKNEEKSVAHLLSLSIDDLFKETYKAVETRNIDQLKDIDLLIMRYFGKNASRLQLEDLSYFNKLMVNFLAWFEWGGKSQWDEAVAIVKQWETILKISQILSQSESPDIAYKALKKSKKYGERLVTMLFKNKLMTPVEIKKALDINKIQQVSSLLSRFEKAGIIVREVDGKNVWVSLGKQGMAVYNEYIASGSTSLSQSLIDALREYDKGTLEKAKEKLKRAREEEPNNPFVVCLLGIVTLENGELLEAGKLLAEAVKLGIDKGREFLFFLFFLFEQMEKLESIRSAIFKLNFQKDEISKKNRAPLHLLSLLTEYSGDTSRAREYKRLSYARFN